MKSSGSASSDPQRGCDSALSDDREKCRHPPCAGEFVLATNPDLLFSDNVIAFMASDKLLPDVMYRIDRHDVPAEVPDNVSIDRQLAWCAANVLKSMVGVGVFPLRVACFRGFGTD